MFDLKTTKIGKTRKKNLGSFLAMLFCTFVIVSTIYIFILSEDILLTRIRISQFLPTY